MEEALRFGSVEPNGRGPDAGSICADSWTPAHTSFDARLDPALIAPKVAFMSDAIFYLDVSDVRQGALDELKAA
jgi:hypothetical protein